MEKQELFKILNSTLWQDYNGYRRDLGLRPNTRFSEWFQFLYGTILFVITSPILIPICVMANPPQNPLSSYFKCFNYLHKYPQCYRLVYDIELTTNRVKLFRTRKKKYGLVFEITHPFCDNKVYPCIILQPKYEMITRADETSYILCRKNRYGIYNSDVKKIVVPIKYDVIHRPDKSRNLFFAELNGVEVQYNSWGDRIIMD